MNRKLKITAFVAFALLALVGGALFYLTSNLDRIVAGLIEKHGSAATGTAVRVDRVAIDLRGATGRVSGLSVGNPEGFDEDAAIAFGDFSLALDAGSLFSDPVVVEDIRIGDAVLNVEQVGGRNNLQVLLDNLRGDTADPPADADAGPGIVIERFALAGATANLSVPQLDERRSVDVPEIVLTGIGRQSGGATGAELARQILEPVIRETLESSAAEATKERVRDELNEKAGELTEGLLDRLGGEKDEADPGEDDTER